MRFSEEAGKEVGFFFFLALLMFSASVSTCELRSSDFFSRFCVCVFSLVSWNSFVVPHALHHFCSSNTVFFFFLAVF